MCTHFEYQCYFEKHPRKRSKIVEQNAHRENSNEYVKPEPPKDDRPTAEELSKLRSMEANSGIAFTKLLGQRLDPSSGPKLFTFGWNLGFQTHVPPTTTPVTDLLGRDQMMKLAALYFERVHPLYGFLEKDFILEQMNRRWTHLEPCKVPDHLFAGLAAIGILFANDSIKIAVPVIVDYAKKALEATSIMQPPNLFDVQSWMLRTFYLRATDHPHATHMSTSTTMHLIEAVGLHQEATRSALHPPAGDQTQDVEVRRRTFWIARMLDTWVSGEYGRTRVNLRGITTELPKPRQGDYTTDYLYLYRLSSALDPEKNDSRWEEFLRQLDEYEARHDALELSKANLGMCGYRRIRLANPTLSPEITNRIINIGLSGLEAARRMSEKGQPWWHVANVPFQVVCVFLAMDIKESIAHIATAMSVLEEVNVRFHTVEIKEALKTARFLVRLSKKRKDEDSDVLGQSLKESAVESVPQHQSVQLPAEHSDKVAPVAFDETPATYSESEDWSLDLLNNSDFDWNFFLTADMPAFNSFAPDGTM